VGAPKRRLPAQVLERARELTRALGEPASRAPAPPPPPRAARKPLAHAERKQKVLAGLKKLHPMD
jgi:hypothetical protein